MNDPGMVIIGAGKAGARAVVSLREHGWTGAITLIGEEAHAPYDRPPLSKSAMTSAEEPAPVFLLDEELLKSLEATFIAGTAATGIDRQAKAVILADGRRIPYLKLLIAAGARPRRLSTPGADRAMMLRDFHESVALRDACTAGRRVAIIGGGFIGLELAASASQRGCQVTVIEAQPRILLRGVTEAIAKRIAERHAAANVSIVTGTGVARIEADEIVLADGRHIPADIVIAGIGAAPAIDLGEAAGLAIDNGIACDAEMRTSDPDIYAAGDCCSFPHGLFGEPRMRLEAWRAAQDQAAVAAENMLGGHRQFEAVPWFWSDQYELNLQIAGLPSLGRSSCIRQLKDGAFIEFHMDATGRLVGASGIGRGNLIARDIRLAEMLIAKSAAPDPALLADPDTALKSLLRPA
jgi:3-phenylpropionate/trans-cinnamate dioxygenase ferredoxin reductase component